MSTLAVTWMFAPVVACLLAAVALGWFGLHVLEREVLFVDLALAQVAALGTTYAVFLGHEPDEPVAYVLGLVFTAFGSVVFALARRFEERVPQEAIIGIAYAVSAGAAAAMLDFAADPHGAEKLQHLMVGNVVWVTWNEIGVLALVCAIVLGVHAAARKPLLAISFDPEGAERDGRLVPAWDMLFYLSFGFVITTLVHVAGVLLIFSYLIVPAVIARLFVDGVGRRLALAYTVSIPVSIAGVAVSYEHAAGPIIVVLLALCLGVALIGWAILRAASPAKTGGAVAGGLAAVGAVLWVFSIAPVEDAHEHEADAPHPTADAGDLPPADAGARDTWYRAHASSPDMVIAAGASEEDPALKLLAGTLLARARRAEGLRLLAQAVTTDVPFVRMEADARLRQLAGEAAPAYDPLAGPDAGVWTAWATTPASGWEERADALALP